MTSIILNGMICGQGTLGGICPPDHLRLSVTFYMLVVHKFGVAVHFPCSTKSSISTQDRSLKNDSFAVRSDCCRSHGCTWWVLYNFRVWNVDLSLRKFCVSIQASLNNATLKHIKRPQNNCRVFSLPWAARMTGFLSVNRIVNLENACNSFRLCFRIKIYYL